VNPDPAEVRFKGTPVVLEDQGQKTTRGKQTKGAEVSAVRVRVNFSHGKLPDDP